MRVFSSVRLNPMSHIVSPECLDQLSLITLCNRFCESGIAGVTSQDFNSLVLVNLLVCNILFIEVFLVSIHADPCCVGARFLPRSVFGALILVASSSE